MGAHGGSACRQIDRPDPRRKPSRKGARRLHCHVVIGTRPEAIKLAPVILALHEYPEDFSVTTVLSGQHDGICRSALDCFDLESDVDFTDRIHNAGLAAFGGAFLEVYGRFVAESQLDLILVQGDTTTAAMAALAGFYNGIAVGHIEAGLRSGDLANPYPEEANRRIIDCVSKLLFAPTSKALSYLHGERHDSSHCILTGNTVVDALRLLTERDPAPDALAAEFDLSVRQLIVVTMHRRESWGRDLEQICRALIEIAESHPEAIIALPVHPNPRVRDTVMQFLGERDRIRLLPPLGYTAFLRLLRSAKVVLTDSGGVQEEAPSFGVPVLVMRRVTERAEAIEAGAAFLVGTETSVIVATADRLLADQTTGARMRASGNPFGDGMASERIRDCLLNWRDGRYPLLAPERSFRSGSSDRTSSARVSWQAAEVP